MKINKILGIATIPVLLSIITIVYALSFTSNPVITPTNTTTLTPLVCTWTSNGATQTNVSWYNGSDLISTVVNATSSQSLSQIYTSKGEKWNCTVVITDDTTTTKKSDIQIIQNALPNKPNVLNITLYEDAYFTTTITATDPDDDTLIYIEISQTCDFDSFNQNSGLLTWTPTNDNVGNHTIVFQASDDGGISAVGIQVEWEVIAVNDAPYFSPGLTTQQAIEDALFTYDIDATDEEHDTIYYYDNSDLFVINSTTGLISFTPDYTNVGNHTIEINISDGSNSTVSSFTLIINSTNHAPNLTFVQNYSMYQNDALSINLTGFDFDNDSVIFSATGNGTGWYIVNTTNGTNIYQQINATGEINFTPDDDNVGNNTFIITLTDSKDGSDSQDINIEVININDPPTINALANQTAVSNVLFSLQVNGSDPDTDSGDLITYHDNTSIFDINTTTGLIEFNVSTVGLINFTPNGTYVGNFSIMIWVNDSFGLTNNVTFNLEIQNNSIPMFNETIINQTAYEDSLFTLKINASDLDGDNITFTDNSSIFDINPLTGLINFTPAQAHVGYHAIRVFAIDQYGARNSIDFTLNITNVNDAPVLDTITFPLMRVNLSFTYTITATDEDADFGISDPLTFYRYNNSIVNISSDGLINFTPREGHEGVYSINITVRDSYNASDSIIVNFTLYNASMAPNISKVYPYGGPLSSKTVFSWIQTNILGSSTTIVNVSENRSMLFDHETFAPAENGNLSFVWYYDDQLISTTNESYNLSFNFTDAGDHNLTLVVTDDLAYSTNFTWNISVQNHNRAPIFNGSLVNISINSTTTYQDYLNKFYDPDGDNLTFNVTSTTLATITITGDDVKLVPLNTGLDTIIFAASDGTAGTSSNNVTLNVTGTTAESDLVQESSSSGGGTRTIEVEVEVPQPVPLKIISPSTVIIYENNTVITPITIENTWNNSLVGVVLGASTNVSGITFTFGRYYWDSISMGSNVTTNLTITSFRSMPTYEVLITANVSTPNYKDSAVIYVNSIEKSMGRYSEEVTNTKITFARDLLEGNPECIELNELLDRAVIKMNQDELEEANKLIDSAIQACKYLVNVQQKEVEKPSIIILKFKDIFKSKVINYILIAVVLGLIIFGIIHIRNHFKKK